MGSNINFKNYGDVQNGDVIGARLAGNTSLARQSSVYSLTFDELQNTMGGFGKDFGSMNMDELLKNIWSAEETQIITSTSGAAGEGNAHVGTLQKQGSLTLPRTLSQKTVDDVWKELNRESGDVKFGSIGGGSNIPQEQRQQTLGEMTLEDFLVRAGVVREDAQEMAKPGNGGFFGEMFRHSNDNASLAPGFQQAGQNNGLLGCRVESNNNSVPNHSPNLALNVGGGRTSQQQTHQLPPQQQPVFLKPANVSFAPSMHMVSNAQLTSPPRSRGPMSAIVEPSRNTTYSQNGGFPSGIGMGGLGAGGVTVASKSPVNQILPDVIVKSREISSPLSPVPYMFRRGRKANGALEKVVERRQKRMIKNRESAARSRARKQAYTLELEAEVQKLKEMNEELQKKQAEIMEMEKDQILETMKQKWVTKRQCLRRTLTGPW